MDISTKLDSASRALVMHALTVAVITKVSCSATHWYEYLISLSLPLSFLLFIHFLFYFRTALLKPLFYCE